MYMYIWQKLRRLRHSLDAWKKERKDWCKSIDRERGDREERREGGRDEEAEARGD